jgi:hypothetical protein
MQSLFDTVDGYVERCLSENLFELTPQEKDNIRRSIKKGETRIGEASMPDFNLVNPTPEVAD